MPMSVTALLDKMRAALRHERRLRGFALVVNNDMAGNLTIVGDESALLIALSNALMGLLAMLEGISDARISVSASSAQGDQVAVVISQNSVSVPDIWIERAFDGTWTDRPGGRAATIGLLSVRAIAESHGGHAAVEPAGRGCRIVLSIPQLVTHH
jgi:C4-dicarboxylate-specific signal transduction histidine kinase